MEYLVGLILAVLVCAFAILSGFDRERVFYPTFLIVVATCYIPFAAEDGSASALARRAIAAAAFCLAHWWVSAGTCGWWPPDPSPTGCSISSTVASSTIRESRPGGPASAWPSMSWPDASWPACCAIGLDSRSPPPSASNPGTATGDAPSQSHSPALARQEQPPPPPTVCSRATPSIDCKRYRIAP